TAEAADSGGRKTEDSVGARNREAQTGESACGGCGEVVPREHVYCPNCGEKQSHRAFCECGDEIRTDWAFCPGCGRRTPAADVLKDR
ncbi:CopG family transcriptional regulator, partial [Halorubrum ezzemoulense]